MNYQDWHGLINHGTKNKALKGEGSVWTDKKKIHSAFDRLFKKFRDSILVVSYRADGIPSIEELLNLLRKYKTDVVEVKRKSYKYVLSSNQSDEVLLIGR